MSNSIQDDLFGDDSPSGEGTGSAPRSGARRYLAPVALGGAALLVLAGVGAVAFTGFTGGSDEPAPADFATETATPSAPPTRTKTPTPTPTTPEPTVPPEQYYVPPQPVAPVPGCGGT